METTTRIILGLYRVYVGIMEKENGNYRDDRGYIGYIVGLKGDFMGI